MTFFIFMEIFIYLFVLLYILDAFWLKYGLSKCRSDLDELKYFPFVSVIVAARNEEKNILQCLNSLLQLSYPKDKFEIIIVDDRSTDNTANIIENFIQTKENFVFLQIKEEGKILKGKQNALSIAIKKSRGEIIMLTDADCEVSPKWIETTVKNFDDNTGIVGGYTVLDSKNWFDGIQSLDWLLNFSAVAASIGNGFPISVIGNNFSIRKKTYDEFGGYENIPFSITEDFALLQAVVKKTKYKIKFILSKNNLVKSFPCKKWSEIYRQKKRWGIGALEMCVSGIFIIGIGYFGHLAILLSFFILPLWKSLILVCAKIFIDILLLYKPIKEFNKLSLLKYFLHFEVYCFIYGLLFPIVPLFSKKVVWKERKF